MAGPGASGRRILAVDDELQILRALKATLRGEGYEVLTAANMEEGLDVAAVSHVDAAIVDLLLPDGDGIELARRLREWSSMPIIVLSAVGEEGEKVRALRAGADDYVTKPFGPQELVARLEAVLRRTSPEPETSVVEVAGLKVDLADHAGAAGWGGSPPDADRVRAAAPVRAQSRPAAHAPHAADGGVGP